MKWLNKLLGIEGTGIPRYENPPPPPKKAKRIVIGETTNCVNCCKPLSQETRTGTGHLKYKDNEIVMANFCNSWCIRELTFKKHNWNGMSWIEDYGLSRYEEPIEI